MKGLLSRHTLLMESFQPSVNFVNNILVPLGELFVCRPTVVVTFFVPPHLDCGSRRHDCADRSDSYR